MFKYMLRRGKIASNFTVDQAESAGLYAVVLAAQAWRSDRGTKFASYACQAIYHEIISEQQREAPSPGTGVRLCQDTEPEAPAIDPDAPAEFAALLVCVRAAVRRLQPEDRVVVLAVARGETCKAVGRRLQHSHEWARQRYLRALKQLRGLLEPMIETE
jgi:DNA-directed RNA polymerase specialized sigma24 family protein